METQTSYIEVSPDFRIFRVKHTCNDLNFVLMAIAYLLVNSSVFQAFCHNEEHRIDIDTNYVFPEDLLGMLAKLPEAMERLGKPHGILSVTEVEMSITYTGEDALWSVDTDYDARRGLCPENEQYLLRRIHEINSKAAIK